MRRLFFFFFYGAIKIHRDGVVRQRSVPACAPFSLRLDIGTLAQPPGDLGRGHDALTASASTSDPGTRGQAQGPRPGPGTLAALGRSGTSEGASGRKPQRGGGWLRSALVSCVYSDAPFASCGSCGCLSPVPPPTAVPRMRPACPGRPWSFRLVLSDGLTPGHRLGRL